MYYYNIVIIGCIYNIYIPTFFAISVARQNAFVFVPPGFGFLQFLFEYEMWLF